MIQKRRNNKLLSNTLFHPIIHIRQLLVSSEVSANIISISFPNTNNIIDLSPGLSHVSKNVYTVHRWSLTHNTEHETDVLHMEFIVSARFQLH